MNNTMNNTMIIAQSIGYKGNSITEANNWIGAVSKGLDMSDESRLLRAKEMGFNTETIFYHGTKYDFDKFDRKFVGKNYLDSGDEGFFFTKSKEMADTFRLTFVTNENEGQILSVFLKYKKPLYDCTKDSSHYNPNDIFDIRSADLIHDLYIENGDAIYIHGTKNDDLCVVFDPNQILSIHAAFDPETENNEYKTQKEISEEYTKNYYDEKFKKYIQNLSFETSSNDIKEFILDSVFNSYLDGDNNITELELENKASSIFKEELEYLLKNEKYKVYRSLKLTDDELERIIQYIDKAGVHWTTEKDVAKRWIASTPDEIIENNKERKTYILEGTVDISDVDIEWTIANRIACPHEFEITTKSNIYFKIDILKNKNKNKIK